MRLPLLFLAVLLATTVRGAEDKTLLILNSYNENEPWVNEMIQPLLMYTATDNRVHCETYDLNNAIMADSLEFKTLCNEIFSVFEQTPPTYVVMIGNLAFNMRSQIKELWGDLPMLFISTSKDFAQLEDYFGSNWSPRNLNLHHQLSQERQDYNFTAIIIPEYYEQTIDLMVRVLPNMDELVFLSDTIYSNRRLAHDIQNYLKEDYPEIRFTWLKAKADNTQTLHNYFVERAPNTGMLISTWLYAKHDFTNWRTPTTSDLKLISTSHTPVFSLHEAYISLGVLGGVYPAVKLAQEREVEILQEMIEGKSMRDIPFYMDVESYPCINYRLLTKYGLSEKNCPPGTVFYSKPLGFWDKYLWQTIAIALLVAIVLIGFTNKNYQQRKKLLALKRNSEFVENMPIPYSTATVRYDSEGNVTTIAYTIKNAAFERILNENVVPDSPFMLFPANFIAPKVTELIKERKTQMFIYHFEQTDTYYEFILCLVNSQLSGKDKNVKTIDVFAIDITTRHKMEMRLASAMSTLDLTLNVAQLVPWQFDITKNKILYDYHTAAASTSTSEKKSDVVVDFEVFVETQIHPEDRAALRQVRDDVRKGKIRDFTLKLRKLDNDDPEGVRWNELVGTVTALDAERKHLVVIGSSRDISERVRTQHEMAVALERANESDRLKSAFLASMSHEIRTPLNAIVGFSNVIAHSTNPDERLEFCEIINKNNEQLLALIDDVLDLAKIESNTIDINYDETDINDMIDHLEMSMSMKVPRGIRFTAIKGAKQCVAEIDENRVKQIINNLLSNACKFTSSGSITFGYEITESGSLYFYVRDTGIGLSPENQKKVFDRFFKLNTFVPGTGLGLSICRNLVEKMGGEIGVESTGEGKGSTFWFTVPYVPCLDANINNEGSDLFFKHLIPKLPAKAGRTRIKILIAEDNESNFRLLAHLLHDHFDLVRANNGHEAVRAYMREDPDVVLMDISMPGMDGYHALKEIRKFSVSVPIIAVTAYVYASDRSKILQFGFDGYVSKPVTQKAIIDAIGHALLK